MERQNKKRKRLRMYFTIRGLGGQERKNNKIAGAENFLSLPSSLNTSY
jgi:hypothetical protein